MNFTILFVLSKIEKGDEYMSGQDIFVYALVLLLVVGFVVFNSAIKKKINEDSNKDSNKK